MFDHKHYVPILKGKQGEFSALSKLSLEVRQHVTPFIDVPLPELEFSDSYPNGKPKIELGAHLHRMNSRVLKYWGKDQPIFIDLYDIDLNSRVGTNHFIEVVFSELKQNDVKAIPVTGLDRDESYEAALLKCKALQNGICVRLLSQDISSPKETITAVINLIQRLQVSISKVDLLLDARSLTEDNVPEHFSAINRFLEECGSKLGEFRTLILSGSAFPQSMEGIKSNTDFSIRRLELDLWKSLVKSKKIERIPTFSDYGIVHPDSVSLDMRKVTLGGKIRYTTAEDWLVLRGESFKKTARKPQYKALASKLLKRKEYLKAEFSFGDDCAKQCAEGTSTQASPQCWIKNDTNHHITFVVKQLASLFGS